VPFVRSSRVPVVIWFQLQDNPNWPGGLLFNSGARKPSYKSFQQLVKTQKPKGNLRLPASVQRKVIEPAAG